MAKKLLFKLLLFIPVLAFVWAVNFYFDPACLRTSVPDYNKKIASVLLSNKNATNLSSLYNSVNINRYYIDGLEKAPEVIVLGSSRSMELRARCFPGKTFFNFSVSGGSVASDRYFYLRLREKKLIPQAVVLVADPWILQEGQPVVEEEVPGQKFSFSQFLSGKFRFHEFLPSKTAEIVSFPYFQMILQKMIKEGWNKPETTSQIIATDQVYNASDTILFDGSFVDKEAVRNFSLKEVNRRAKDYISRADVYRLEEFYRLEKKYFNELVDMLEADHVEIILFLPPYHPIVYNFLSSQVKHKMVLEAEEYLKEFARAKGIKLVGSYDPSALGMDESYFRDGMHLKEDVFQKLFAITSAELRRP